MSARKPHLERDLLILAISIICTVGLEYYGVFDWVFFQLRDMTAIAALIAGFFFTSLFTITPAAASLAELANYASLVQLSFFGAIGAVLGDLVLFLFIRDAISEDITQIINRSWRRWLTRIFSHPLLQWLVPVIGALIIASPLPDELGIAMMGLTKTRLIVLLPISFAMNFLGVALVWFAAQVL